MMKTNIWKVVVVLISVVWCGAAPTPTALAIREMDCGIRLPGSGWVARPQPGPAFLGHEAVVILENQQIGTTVLMLTVDPEDPRGTVDGFINALHEVFGANQGQMLVETNEQQLTNRGRQVDSLLLNCVFPTGTHYLAVASTRIHRRFYLCLYADHPPTEADQALLVQLCDGIEVDLPELEAFATNNPASSAVSLVYLLFGVVLLGLIGGVMVRMAKSLATQDHSS